MKPSALGSVPPFTLSSDVEIVLAFNAEWRGFANYYALASDVKRKLNKAGYMALMSCLKTIAAIERLVKAKRFPKDGLVACIARDPSTKILAQDDSLAENVHRVALHPLDQFRAFLDMREKVMSDEEIAVARS